MPPLKWSICVGIGLYVFGRALLTLIGVQIGADVIALIGVAIILLVW